MTSCQAFIQQWNDENGVGWSKQVEGRKTFLMDRQNMPSGFQATAVGYGYKANPLYGMQLLIGDWRYVSETDTWMRALKVAPFTPAQLTRFTVRESSSTLVLRTSAERLTGKKFLVLNRLNDQKLACRKSPEGVLAALTEVFAHKNDSGCTINPGFWTDGSVLYVFVRRVTDDAKEWIRSKLGRLALYACVRKIVIVNAVTTQLVMVTSCDGVPVLVTKRVLLDCHRQLRAQDTQWVARRPEELRWTRMRTSELIQRMPGFPDEATNLVWQMRLCHMQTGHTDLDLYQQFLTVLSGYGPRVYAFHPFETGEITLSGISEASVAAVMPGSVN